MEGLTREDSARASRCLEMLAACGLSGALTGSLAISAHLSARHAALPARPLNDIDLVVADFAVIPASLCADFLVHHVHPYAQPGKLLLQLVDPEQRVRIDIFRQLGHTLLRTVSHAGTPVPLVALEDVTAHITCMVIDRLQAGAPLAVKYAAAFTAMLSHVDRGVIQAAWSDHRKENEELFAGAATRAAQLIARRSDLLIAETYSSEIRECPACVDVAPFTRACPDAVVGILGYS